MLKNKIITGVMLSSSVLSMAATSLTAFAGENEAGDTSQVTATIKNGGMDLQINGNADGNDVDGANLTDIFLGEYEVADDLKPVEINNIAEVTDHTGGLGWTLSARITNFADTEETITNELRVGHELGGIEENFYPLNDVDTVFTSGLGQVDTYSLHGTLAPSWGINPQVGDYVQNVAWTLSAVAADDAQG